MTEAELAWAAGLFEGEGTIRVNTPTKRNRGALMVSVTNTDVRIVEFFQSRWPGYMKPVSRASERHAQGFAWVVAASVAAQFLADIRPYLRTSRNQRRATLGLWFQRQKTTKRSINNKPEYLDRQELYYRVFRRINQNGAERFAHQRENPQ